MLGVNTDHISKMELNSFDSQLYDIKMGYTNPAAPEPHDAIKWMDVENTFEHPFSLTHRFYQYGYYKLNEFITPTEYLKLPADMGDIIIDSIGKGAKQRATDEARKAKDNKDGGSAVDIENELKHLLK